MARKVSWAVLVLFVLSSLGIAGFFQNPSNPSHLPLYRDGYLLVRFYETGTSSTAAAIRTAVVQQAGGGTIVRMMGDLVPGLALVKLPAGVDVQKARIAFQATPGVQYASPDYIRTKALVPNDTYFGQLWGLHNVGQSGGTFDADIDAPEAWNLSVGNQNIVVAVIDTGIDYTHPDLQANLWVNTAELNGSPGVDDDGNGLVDDIYGYDFGDWDSDPMDEDGHGTHVAGTIGAVGNNSRGVVGVNWNVRVMALKASTKIVIDNVEHSVFYDSSLIAALNYAVQRGVKVSNNSYGGGSFNPAMYDALMAAQRAGHLFVAAAGNDASNNDAVPFYPAGYDLDLIVSVMATNRNDQRAYFSNWGRTTVDLAAPGQDILSTVPLSLDTDGTPDGYAFYSGTSMASPHVAGAAALLWSLSSTLTAAEVKQILMGSVDPLPSLNGFCVTGGRLNLYKALSSVQIEDTIPPFPNPAQWDIVPTATGLRHIVMQAQTATDPSGVQYYFECLENPNLSSGWQDEPLYILGDTPDERALLQPGTTYTFRCKVRDKSTRYNETAWSEAKQTTTAVEVDNLPPAPNPPRWKAVPRALGNLRLGMEAVTAYDENGVEYFFDCVEASEGNPDDYDSGWLTVPYYFTPVIPGGVAGKEFRFVLRVRQAGGGSGGLPEAITADSEPISVGYTTVPVTRHVPSAAYPTIQIAVNASRSGDRVVIHPGLYRETNILVDGKAITIRSLNPDNPDVVSQTIIDCEDIWNFWAGEERRAFIFRNVGRNTVLAGLTIRNATAFDDPDLYANSSVWESFSENGEVIYARGRDGRDAYGGAIYIGQKIPAPTNSRDEFSAYPKEFREINPASPTIRNCIFERCTAIGQAGSHGGNAPAVGPGRHGLPGARGGYGGNAYGGAIFAVQGSSPLIYGCRFTDCAAVGGNAGNGGNGSDGGEVPDSVERSPGYDGGSGGDAGKGGCAWGGAIYFEPDCKPELYNVSISNCYVQVGEAGRGGNGGNGGAGKDGPGGRGGPGGVGGDLREPYSAGGAIFFGENTEVLMDGCTFDNCRVIVELRGDYSGGNGGNGGPGGNAPNGPGGNGGPAYFVPDKLYELGTVRDALGNLLQEGVRANGGTGGNGNPGGAGGFRFGGGGSVNGRSFSGHTGIWPSNLYYMAYYWEDTGNIDNSYTHTEDLEDYLRGTWFEWDVKNNYPPFPIEFEEGYTDILIVRNPIIFYSPYYPFYGFLLTTEEYEVTLETSDPNNADDPATWYWSRANQPISSETVFMRQLSATDPDKPNAGACAGANFYGAGSVVTMKNTTISNCRAFANHGGAELYDKGSRAVFENCVFEGNSVYADVSNPTDYRYEGFGGGIFADQPESMVFTNCVFRSSDAFSGGALYCNFAPSTEDKAGVLQLTNCTFSGNAADYHFVQSSAGGLYAGNSLTPYEESYFNNFFPQGDSPGDRQREIDTFVTSEYINHGRVNFYYIVQTELWDNRTDLDRILAGEQSPRYTVSITDGLFENHISPSGGGFYADASQLEIRRTQFTGNTGHLGASGFVYGCNLTASENVFSGNSGVYIAPRRQLDSSSFSSLICAAGLYVSDSDVLLTSNRFVENESDGYAGALALIGPPLNWDRPQEVINNLFFQNTALSGGGAVQAAWSSDVSLVNCTFVDNTATNMQYGAGGALSAYDSFVDVTNSIFWNNKAVLGSQISVGDPFDTWDIPFTTVLLDYSIVQGGLRGTYVAPGIQPWLWYGPNNLQTDPLLVDFGSAQMPLARTAYLSHLAAGQLADSPCINAGWGDAAWLASRLGYPVTTRTDHEPDSGRVDIGYHYNADPTLVKTYTLNASVFVADVNPMGKLKASWTANDVLNEVGPAVVLPPITVTQGTVVRLEAVPDDPSLYRVRQWRGTNNDASVAAVNFVVVGMDRTATVEFEVGIPKFIPVPSQVATLSEAIALARDGDTIVLAPRPGIPYTIEFVDTDFDGIGEGLDLQGKSIVITSENPDDPLIVASTVIDCGGTRYQPSRGFVFRSGEGPSTVIQGLTIRNGFMVGALGLSGAIVNGPYPPIEQTPLPPPRANSGMDAFGDGYGGAILCTNGSSPTIRKCVFENCTVTGGYGGDGNNGRPAIENAQAPDNDGQSGGHGGSGYGMGYGGAIACVGNSSPIIEACVFRNNKAMGGCGGNGGNGSNGETGGKGSWGGNGGDAYGNGVGGAIYADTGCQPTIRNCIFENNIAQHGIPGTGGSAGTGQAYQQPYNVFYPGADGTVNVYPNQPLDGGAVRLGNDAEANIIGCTFIGNYAFEDTFENWLDNLVPVTWRMYTNGGAVAVGTSSRLLLQDCLFKENMGGAVWCDDYTTLEVENCEFSNNGTYEKVPGIDFYTEYELAFLRSVDESLLSDMMESLGEAGAITLGKHSPSAVVTNSRFFGNYTLGSGGAIRSDSSLTLTDCVFGGNTASRGGAVEMYFNPTPTQSARTLMLQITGCSFADNDAFLLGGAVFGRKVNLAVENGTFVRNEARSGGGIYVTEGEMNIGNSIFTLNTATGIKRYYQTASGEGQGGAIACMNAKADIWNSRFAENRAEGQTGQGGAVNFTNGDVLLSHRLSNCLFTDNWAQQSGGAVAAKVGSSPVIEFCTFSGNLVGASGNGGAVYIGPNGAAVFSHTIVAGSNGTAVAEDAPADSQFQRCLFYGHIGADYTASLPADTLRADPRFEAGPLGKCYLNQTLSPAVNAGLVTASSIGLHQFTTDPADLAADTGMADLGYHYPFASGLPTYTLNAYVEGGLGTVTVVPAQPFYYKGQIVELTAQVNTGYVITGWSGTIHDSSTDTANRAVIDGNKVVLVKVRPQKTLYVGGSAAYNSLSQAMNDAKDGDIIVVNPGLYQTTSNTNLDLETFASFAGKRLTIRSSNPDDPETVENTIFDRQGLYLIGLKEGSLIEGLTFRQSNLIIQRSSATIRNCRFVSCNWNGGTGVTPQGCAQDGVNGGIAEGGAIDMRESSVRFIGCLFEGNSMTGGNGTNGNAGCDAHPDGGDGGWPGWAYGGAVSCQFSSDAVFENCTFRNNFVLGGNGGNGGAGKAPPNPGYGGLGGGWNYSDQVEIGWLIDRGWDGWTNGHKYDFPLTYLEMYDWEIFAKWFELDTNKYKSWKDFYRYYQYDPYDAYLSYWRYGGYGGAVFCAYGSSARFVGCVFEGNSSNGGVSGVGGSNSFGDVPEPSRALDIPNAGGAVYAMYDCTLEFENCVLANNRADTNVQQYPHTIHVAFGGAVAYQYDCVARFINCTLVGNEASDGGAIYANASATLIQDCNVADNTAYLGGGFFQIYNEAVVKNSQFRRNVAHSPSFAAPVENVFLGQGGGIYTGSTGLSLRDTVFVQNAADFSGGGLFMTGVSSVSSKIKNCLFAQNSSGRDGGGASVFWGANPVIQNCTFADNQATGRLNYPVGTGGGLYVGYNSTVDVIDSIFWLNYALQGAQATVGSGFDTEPYPSVMNLSYSNVLNVLTSGNSIYVRPGSTLNRGAGVFSANPMFEGPVDPTREVLPEEYYYLNPSSPCIDAGSDLARNLDLDGYTTQLSGVLDRGEVDLGYHYFVVRRTECAKVDNSLALSGRIDLSDLAILGVRWLNQPCGSPGWCGGADLNFDRVVDMSDMASLAVCWLEEDTLPPTPSPMQWAELPAPLPLTTASGTPNPDYRIDKVAMKAIQAHDAWWPDEYLEYAVECVSHPAVTTPLVWTTDPSRVLTGLYPGEPYEFVVYARDPKGNVTLPSAAASVRPGSNYNLLAPNPAQFEIPPAGSGPTTITMTAVQATGVPAVPAPLVGKGTFHVEYCFIKTDAAGNPLNLPAGTNPIVQQDYDPSQPSGKIYTTTPWRFTDTGLVLGQTYYYRVFTRLVFRETSTGTVRIVALTEPSAVFAAGTIEVDLTPPTPNPAQWEIWPSHLQYDTWYHYMRAAEAQDPSGVEYRFVCVTFPSLSSGWQNVDNVAGIVDPDFTPRLPNEYWVPVYVSTAYYDYYILVRDRSPNQNQTQPSATCRAGTNAATCPNLPIQ
ncbi:MAG: S8 family serine peptidase [Anaerohalosphaeraceae bacterium]